MSIIDIIAKYYEDNPKEERKAEIRYFKAIGESVPKKKKRKKSLRIEVVKKCNNKKKERKRKKIYFKFSIFKDIMIKHSLSPLSWNGAFHHKEVILKEMRERNMYNPNTEEVLIKKKDKVNYSNDWKKIRKEVIARDNQECCTCGDVEYLTVHHKDCDSLNNNLDNLVTLCWYCHSKFHPHMNESPPKRWKKW